MLDSVSSHIDHPLLLAVIALACSMLLPALARWFFGDMETFLADMGIEDHAVDDVWWKLIRFSPYSYWLWMKIVGFVGIYGIIVGLSYASTVKLVY
jgi:hypothetical protein